MQSGSNLTAPIWHHNVCFLGEKEPKIGKWSEQQKKIFNIYSKLYEPIPNKYELMTQYIPTRTACQIRSHWQKFNEKMDRDKQRIVKRLSEQDMTFGKYYFWLGFHLFKAVASDIRKETEEAIVEYEIPSINFDVNNSGKPNSWGTISNMTRRSQMESELDQEVFFGNRRVCNYIIVGYLEDGRLQKGEQLQKVGKVSEESNTLSNMESIQRQNRRNEKESFAEQLKFERNEVREKRNGK